MASDDPTVTLHPLTRASGSATYTHPPTTTKILATVNAPLEPTRRDELPEEAFLDVHVRPFANASGGPRERWLEDVLARALRSVILVEEFPRQVIRVGLQVLSDIDGDYEEAGGRGAGDGQEETADGSVAAGCSKRDVSVLPALLNAAVLVLIDGRVPMRTVCVADLVVVSATGNVVTGMQIGRVMGTAKSIHAMAFDASGTLVLEESVGAIGLNVWEEVVDDLRRECLSALAKTSDGEDAVMGQQNGGQPWLRAAVEESVRQGGAWRETG